MTGFASKVKTTLALGLPNIARVASYRLGVKLGVNPVRRLQAAVPQGPFFKSVPLGPLPVLNNYPGWLAQMITDNECGFTVPPDARPHC